LAKIGNRIDPLTFAEKWHIPNPKEFAKRLVSFLWTPDKYMTEVLGMTQGGESESDVMDTIQRINNGESVPPKENASKEYLAQYEAFIRSPEFKQLDSEVQKLHIVHLKETIQLAKQALSGGGPNNTATVASANGPEMTSPSKPGLMQSLIQKFRGGK